MSRQKHKAGRRPHPASWDPYPVWLIGCPITGLPDEIGIRIAPVAGNPKMVVRRLRTARTRFERSRGRVVVRNVLNGLIDPKSLHSLPATGNLFPITWHPALSRRRLPPHPSDPDKPAAIVVPLKVAR